MANMPGQNEQPKPAPGGGEKQPEGHHSPGTQQPPRDPGLTPGGPTTQTPAVPMFPQPLQPTLPGVTVPVTPPKKPGGGSPL